MVRRNGKIAIRRGRYCVRIDWKRTEIAAGMVVQACWIMGGDCHGGVWKTGELNPVLNWNASIQSVCPAQRSVPGRWPCGIGITWVESWIVLTVIGLSRASASGILFFSLSGEQSPWKSRYESTRVSVKFRPVVGCLLSPRFRTTNFQVIPRGIEKTLGSSPQTHFFLCNPTVTIVEIINELGG